MIWAPCFLVLYALYLVVKLHESSRYLMSINKMEEVEKYLNKMSKVNKRGIEITYLCKEVELDDQKKKAPKPKGICTRLFGLKNLRTTLALIVIWFS